MRLLNGGVGRTRLLDEFVEGRSRWVEPAAEEESCETGRMYLA